MQEGLYTIGVVSKLVKLHPQTIRHYEKLGLLKFDRQKGKTRLFSQAQVERLKKIKELSKDLGINLAGIEVILNLLDEIEKLNKRIEYLENILKKVGDIDELR